MDAAFGKVRDVARRRSVDERRGSDDAASKRLSVFIHRKKRGAKRDAPDLERNLSARSGEDSLFPSNRSESSFVESGHSSLLTDDDDCDHERYVRGSVSSILPYSQKTKRLVQVASERIDTLPTTSDYYETARAEAVKPIPRRARALCTTEVCLQRSGWTDLVSASPYPPTSQRGYLKSHRCLQSSFPFAYRALLEHLVRSYCCNSLCPSSATNAKLAVDRNLQTGNPYDQRYHHISRTPDCLHSPRLRSTLQHIPSLP